MPVAPTATAQPIPTATATPSAGPPGAELWLADSEGQPGKLGSYSYRAVSADTPWLPAASLPTFNVPTADADLTLAVPLPPGIGHWSVSYADATDTGGGSAVVLDSGGDFVDPDAVPPSARTALEEAEFSGPPSGSWVLSATVQFADGMGDATYYWHLVVP